MPRIAYATEPGGCLGPALLLRVVKAARRTLCRKPQRELAVLASLIHVESPRSTLGNCSPVDPGATACRPPCPLPADVWGVVAEFMPSDVLSLVSSTLRLSVPRRYVVLHATNTNAPGIAERYSDDYTLRRMALTCHRMGEEARTHLQFVGQLPSLEILTVQLNVHQFHNHLADRTVEALAEAFTCPRLRSLKLDLHCEPGGLHHCRLTDKSLLALASVARCQTLECLSLNLAHNMVQTDGLRALVDGLVLLPRLRALELNLTSNIVGNAGATALAGLRRVATLERLTLKLGGSGVSGAGLAGLAAVLEAPALRHLWLYLSRTLVTDDGLSAFINAVRWRPQLETLVLDVASSRVTPEGLQGLDALARCPKLQHLTLGLGPLATDTVAMAIARLVGMASLRDLTIDMCGSPVTDVAALAIAGLRTATALRSLTIDFSRTCVGDAGAQGLAALVHCPSLDSLMLDIQDTQVGIRGRVALRHMRTRRPWKDFQLFCYDGLGEPARTQ